MSSLLRLIFGQSRTDARPEPEEQQQEIALQPSKSTSMTHPPITQRSGIPSTVDLDRVNINNQEQALDVNCKLRSRKNHGKRPADSFLGLQRDAKKRKLHDLMNTHKPAFEVKIEGHFVDKKVRTKRPRTRSAEEASFPAKKPRRHALHEALTFTPVATQEDERSELGALCVEGISKTNASLSKTSTSSDNNHSLGQTKVTSSSKLWWQELLPKTHSKVSRGSYPVHSKILRSYIHAKQPVGRHGHDEGHANCPSGQLTGIGLWPGSNTIPGADQCMYSEDSTTGPLQHKTSAHAQDEDMLSRRNRLPPLFKAQPKSEPSAITEVERQLKGKKQGLRTSRSRLFGLWNQSVVPPMSGMKG